MNKLPFLHYRTMKAIPTVFDDTLSFYELLNKVVMFLNDVIENNNNQNENIEQLQQAMEELKTYVDTYFDNLDVYDEVVQKIDQMVSDGVFDEIINERVLQDLLDQVETAITIGKSVVDVSILEFKDYRVGDDWSEALRQALLVGTRVYIPKGYYQINRVAIPSGKMIYGEGRETILENTTTGNMFRIHGTVGEEIHLTEDMVDFSKTATLADASNLQRGSTILLKSQRDCLTYQDSGVNWTLGYATPSAQGLYFGEFMTVDSVNGNEVTFTRPTIYPWYYKDKTRETSISARVASTVQPVNFNQGVVIKNFTLKQKVGRALDFQYARDAVVDDVHMIGDGYTDSMIEFISFRYCYNCLGINSSFLINHAVSPSQHHYINIYKMVSSMYCGFRYCESDNATQPWDMSYAAGGIPATSCFVDACHSRNSSQTGMTSHGGTYLCDFTNNIITGTRQGINCRTRNAKISGNTLIGFIETTTNNLHAGIVIYEGHACDCVVENNTITNFYCSVVVADGSDLGETFRHCGLILTGNTLRNYRYGFRTIKNSQSFNNPMNIKIYNNSFNPTRVNDTQCVRLEKNTVGVDIKNNDFYCLSADVNARAIWANYNASEINIDGNLFRQFATAIYIRGWEVEGEPKTTFYENNNQYIDVGTRISFSTSKTTRLDLANFKQVKFVEVTNFADAIPNTLFVYVDGNLYFKKSDGTNIQLSQ